MAKTLTENQCDILHQQFGASECCLCKANAEIQRLQRAVIKRDRALDWINKEWNTEMRKSKDMRGDIRELKGQLEITQRIIMPLE